MKFLNPAWLWGILLLPLVYWFVFKDEKNKKSRFGQFIHESLWKSIAPEMDPQARLKKAGVWLLGLSFILLALARPQMGTHEETVQVSGMDIMIVLDVSSSMDAEDIVPSRLQKAKHAIHTLVEHLAGDRVGLVAFAGSSYIASPLTTDTSYFLDTLQIINPRMIQNQGTDIGLGLDTSLKGLERGSEEIVGATATNPAQPPSHAVILISDGEDHEEQAIEMAKKFKKSGVKLFVLGIGTEKGAPVPVKDDSGKILGYKRDRKGESIITTFRSDFLQKVAQEAGGKYWSITPAEEEIGSLLQDLGSMNRADYAEKRYLVYEDRYQIPLFIGLLLLLVEISFPVRKLAFLVFIGLVPLSGRAESFLSRPTTSLDTYLENKRGIEAFQQGKIDEAQKDFGAAQARDPSRPELEFNQGVVQMQQGQVDSAIEAFKNSGNSAYQSKDQSLLGKSLYNLGNAYAKKGDLQNAAQSFLGAIQSAKVSQDKNLESRARKNLELLLSQLQKQKQQQEDQKKENKDGKQDQQNQKESQGSKDQEKQANADKKQDKSQENRQYQESHQNSREQFHSKKLNPEDAERVLSELSNREKELQEKILNQHGQTNNNAKDW